MDQIFSKAWELFSKHWKFLMAVVAIGMLVPLLIFLLPYFMMMASAISFSDAHANPNLAVGGFLSSMIAFFVLGFIMSIVMMLTQVGLMKSALIITKGGTPTVRDLFLDFDTYLRGFGAGFLCCLMVFMGFGLCFLPAFIFAFFISMVPFIIFDDPKISAVQAIGKSFKLIMTDWKNSAIILFLGGIILNMTSMFGYPFVFILEAVLYLKLKSEFENPTRPNYYQQQYYQQQYYQQRPPQYNQQPPQHNQQPPQNNQQPPQYNK